MATQNLFRSSATRRFDGGASDNAFTPARPAHWVVVLSAAVVLLSAVAWSVLASTTATVTGRGYLLPTSGISVVVSPVTGTVVEVLISRGDAIEPGDPVAVVARASDRQHIRAEVAGRADSVQRQVGDWVEAGQNIALITPDEPLVVHAFVPLDRAALVDVGMPVQFSLGAYPPAQFGTLRGEVARIETLAATPLSLGATLHDEALIEEVSALGPVVEVVISFDPADLAALAARVDAPIRIASHVDVRIEIETSAPIGHLLGS